MSYEIYTPYAGTSGRLSLKIWEVEDWKVKIIMFVIKFCIFEMMVKIQNPLELVEIYEKISKTLVVERQTIIINIES